MNITIAGVETKTGVKNDRPWTLYKIAAAEGGRYSTFDAALGNLAQSNIGKTAEITFESTEKGTNLTTLSLITTPITSPPIANQPAAQPAQTWPESDTAKYDVGGSSPNWELIGLRKTRCALWAAVLSNASLNVAGAEALAAFARELVIAAERDIFDRTGTTATANGDLDDIPFQRTFA